MTCRPWFGVSRRRVSRAETPNPLPEASVPGSSSELTLIVLRARAAPPARFQPGPSLKSEAGRVDRPIIATSV